MPCVSASCDVKKIFDDSLKRAVIDQMKETIKREVNKKKSKGLEYKDNCGDGWALTVIAEIELDGDTLEIKFSTTALGLKGRDTFQATKKRTVKGVDTDNIEKELLKHTDAAMEAAMKDIISVML